VGWGVEGTRGVDRGMQRCYATVSAAPARIPHPVTHDSSGLTFCVCVCVCVCVVNVV
jgi:hypothetical protein